MVYNETHHHAREGWETKESGKKVIFIEGECRKPWRKEPFLWHPAPPKSKDDKSYESERDR